MRNSVTEKVLQSTDIVELIQEYLPLTRKGKEFVGLCPFHPDHKPSMQVVPAKQIFKCFACGAGGDALKFVQMRQRIEFHEALQVLAQRAGISLNQTEHDRHNDELRDQLRQAISWACLHFQRNLRQTAAGKAALQYALERGLTAETIEQHGLGFAIDSWDDMVRAGGRAGYTEELLREAGLAATNESGRTYDRFRNRLIFPISDAVGRPIALGGRTLGDDPAKYLNSPETSLFSKSRVLYGWHLARQSIEQRSQAIVVEGYMDAVLLHQFGFTNAVAALGTALTDSHVKLLKQRTDKVVLCFDGDQAGIRAADRAVEASLLGGMEVRVAVLASGMDPADCVLAQGAAGFGLALQAAVEALEFKWVLTKRAFGDGNSRTRRAAADELLEFIASVMASGGINPLEQGLLVRRLSDLLAVPAEATYQMLVAARKRGRRGEAGPPSAVGASSRYAESVRGLPVGLVAAVEDALGLLLADARCNDLVDEALGLAIGSCAAWARLYAVMQSLTAENGSYARADVIARCDDAELCELVSLACVRVAGVTATREAFLATGRRVEVEWNTLRLGDLQQDLLRGAAEGVHSDEVFRDMLDVARGRDFALAAQTGLSAATQGHGSEAPQRPPL